MQLRDYQQESCDAVWEWLKSGRGNPLVVLPTGAGKSLVIAELCREAVETYDGRVIVLQHRKELIEQNAAKLRSLGVPLGLYSAGLNRRQINEPVILAGIQSVYSKALDFGRRHLVVIDEAHLVGQEGMFQQFLTELSTVNPGLKVVGLTATPFRTGEGSLVGGLWSGVCYEAKIPRLIADGYLCPITNQPSATRYETEGLHIRAGEFIESEMAALFDDERKIDGATKEVQQATLDRHSVIVFCSGVNHAFHVAERLNGAVIHGGTLPLERSQILEDFKNGRIKFLCNCDVLTTGFDAPNIDAVVLLRATLSPGLFCQMAGRGFRLHPSKTDCLILDFGGNIGRHGPLDAIDFGKVTAKGTGEAVEKVCPGCDEAVAAGVRVCSCGFIFPPPELKHDETADTASAVLAKPETFAVSNWVFSRHAKKEPNSLRVTYFLEGDLQTCIEEWVCLEHEGFARAKADKWWAEHSDDDLDSVSEALRELGREADRIDAALALERDGQVKRPLTITAIRDGRWWRVLSREVGELQEKFEIPF